MELIQRWETESTYLQPPWPSGDKDKSVHRSDLIKPIGKKDHESDKEANPTEKMKESAKKMRKELRSQEE